MNLDDIDDFDPAAFGFSGFGGGKSKGKAAASATSKAKHVAAAKPVTVKAAAAAPAGQLKDPQSGEGEATAASHSSSRAERPQPQPGSSAQSTEDDAEASLSMPGPSRLSARNRGGKDPREDDDEQSEEEDGDNDGDDTDYFPVSHEAIMKDHTKAVTALALDPAGARLVTGGYDYDIKMWDFGGMQADFRPFRSMEPYENYHVHDVAWDATGSNYIVACGLLTPKMYDRDGTLIGEFAKGDMFLRDLKNTVGHVGPLTSVCWHPTDPTRFLTSSMDGTIRIWDSGERFKSKTTIVVKSKERGGRTKVTKALWSSDGKWIAAVCTDGTINVWSTNSNYARPNYTAENAHEKGTETSGLTFSLDNRTLLSRGGDGTVKLWDIRAIKKPLAIARDLPAVYPETNVIFSPDEQYVLTGTAGRNSGSSTEENETAKKEARIQDGGKIVVMKKDTLEVVKQFSVTKGSVIRLAWPSRINQIFASTSTGEVHVLYSPTSSEKGAVLAASRAPRRRRELDEAFDPASMPIITPHALPMFKEANPYEVGDAGVATKRKRENVRNNAVKSHKPDVPVRGPGHGGRVGEAANKYLVRDQIDTRSEDPRAALLKYANEADNVNKVFDTRQYDEEAQQDQPGYGKGQQRSK